MYFVQWLSNINSLKDFLETYLSPYRQEVCAATAQMSAIDQSQLGGDKLAMKSSPPPTEAAKKLFFDHWNYIDYLAKQRFPYDENQQFKASQYVREALVDDDWKKLRAFEGKDSQFKAFIKTVTNRLLTDFQRHQEGRVRPTAWLKRQQDPIYGKAYQRLHKQKDSKREAVDILLTTEKDQERWKIEEVVSDVLADDPRKVKDQEVPFYEEGDNDDDNLAPIQASLGNTLEKQIEHWNEQVILEVLLRWLNNEIDDKDIPLELRNLLDCLAKYVRLTEEQCLILRLHYLEAFPVKKIAQRLSLTDKQVRYRLEKTESALSEALKQCGIL